MYNFFKWLFGYSDGMPHACRCRFGIIQKQIDDLKAEHVGINEMIAVLELLIKSGGFDAEGLAEANRLVQVMHERISLLRDQVDELEAEDQTP